MARLILALLLCAPAWATFTIDAGSPVNDTAGVAGCNNSSGTSCAVTVTSTSTGHLMIFEWWGLTTPPSAVSGGCGAWVNPAGSNVNNGTIGMSTWYCLSSTSGVTTITATVTSNSSRGAAFYSFAFTATSVFFDGASNAVNGSLSSVPGLGFSLSGGNDLLMQFISISGGVVTSSINESYVALTGGSHGPAYLRNTILATAPTWTIGSAATSITSGLAIAEAHAKGTGHHVRSQ